VNLPTQAAPRLLPCSIRVPPLVPHEVTEALIEMLANALVTSYRTSSTGGSPTGTAHSDAGRQHEAVRKAP
jgi:hypothetical protein